jgi:capsular polysaccharide biosynthesis protein
MNGFRAALRKIRYSLRTITRGAPIAYVLTKEFIEKHPGDWHQAFDAEIIQRKSPIRYGQRAIDLTRRLDTEIPPLGVASLKKGKLIGPQGWAISAEGYFLAEASWYGRHVQEVMMPRYMMPPRRLKGVCLSLASDFSVKNYGHFLLDCLGRFGLFLAAGFKLSDVDYIYCPKPFGKTATKVMTDLGIPLSKCIWSDDVAAVSADIILAPSFPGTRRNYPRWLAEFLQRPYRPAPPRSDRRLYIPRQGTRNVANQARIIPILEKYGFEIYDYTKYSDEPSYFSTADMIIGAHGAGLTNIVFCQENTKVLELIPSDHVHPYFFTLAESARLDYAYLVGDSLGTRPENAYGPSPFDFCLDESEFDFAVKQMISGRG